ncbi:unnamed protein product, partial [Oncorhynchus mykiss]
MPHNCHCKRQRAVCLKNPEGTCQMTSDVLVKTICFMKSLPSFSQLPAEDQLSLLKDCWVPLFSLGLAQERTVFEVKDVPQASMLRRILLNGQGPQSEEEQEVEDEGKRLLPTLAGVHKLRSCLNRLWTLDLSPKEYAYLKGAMLFNPDVPGLSTTVFINSLQQEAQRALREVVLTLHPGDLGRFSCILLSTSDLQTVSQSLITELFFRPVIGQADLFDLLREMLTPVAGVPGSSEVIRVCGWGGAGAGDGGRRGREGSTPHDQSTGPEGKAARKEEEQEAADGREKETEGTGNTLYKLNH